MKNTLLLSDFDYALPKELIASFPKEERSSSRLMVVHPQGSIEHFTFKDLVNLLNKNDLLIFNNTKVFPARLYGTKPSGGKIECLIERVLSSHEALVHLKTNKKIKINSEIIFLNSKAKVIDKKEDLFYLDFDTENLFEYLEKYGVMPLPPYIQRSSQVFDKQRYQTVYAEKRGAVAAPTAGLHFDEDLIRKIKQKGIEVKHVTLHVGAGTFKPVKNEDILQHTMHAEYMEVGAEVCEAVLKCRNQGGRVVAVGTTSARCLETAAQNGEPKPFKGETRLFIYPGYLFRSVDALLTNFHLPKSTLLMLVSAFAGSDNIKKAYQTAIQEKYRFFSYGDAMFLIKNLAK